VVVKKRDSVFTQLNPDLGVCSRLWSDQKTRESQWAQDRQRTKEGDGASDQPLPSTEQSAQLLSFATQ
jgi:hypothetical protein